jgi:pimeloyl-ACP methyl ester carboxylesterase
MTALVREGVTLAYDEAGTDAPAIVFVHGAACHRGFWNHQMEYFSRHRHVVAVDLRGHGASDAPAQPGPSGTLPTASRASWRCP